MFSISLDAANDWVTRDPGDPLNRPGIIANIQSPEGVASAVIGTSGKKKGGRANPNQMAPVPVAPVYISEDPEAGTAARDMYKLCVRVCGSNDSPTTDILLQIVSC